MLKLWLRIALVFATFNTGASFAAGTEKFYENASSNNALLNLLNHSKKSIDIEIYEMKDPSVHAAIRSALDRGLQVRIVQEPLTAAPSCRIFEVPSASDTAECTESKALVKDVRAKGGTYVPFNLATLCGTPGTKCFEHGKMVISDKQFVFLSTGNFNSSNLCNKVGNPEKCNRDYSVLSWDAGTVSTLQQIFELDIVGKTYDLSSILQNPAARKITVSPYSLAPLVQFIRSAKTMVQIENQYLKDQRLNDALIEVAKRGVKVYVMVASVCSFGKPKPTDIAQWTNTFTAFDQAGIQSRAFTKSIKVGGIFGYLHAKALLIDSKVAWVGSVNGSVMSTSNNREFGIFLEDETEALKLGAFLKSDFLEPGAETWQQSVTCEKDFPSGLESRADRDGLTVN